MSSLCVEQNTWMNCLKCPYDSHCGDATAGHGSPREVYVVLHNVIVGFMAQIKVPRYA